jgi:uncharacterized protein with PIN domain
MLRRLVRWLRAAGHDTAIAAPGTPDRAILAQLRAEQRLLLTRDRALAARAPGRVLLLTDPALPATARALRLALRLDWLRAPFTRCLMDNAELRPASTEEIQKTPPESQALPGPIRTCPDCGRLYWPGSHVRRMRARLEEWAR